MAHEQLRRLDERQLRPYRADDEPAVLALWARALPRWPVSTAAFRAKATGAEQLVMVAVRWPVISRLRGRRHGRS